MTDVIKMDYAKMEAMSQTFKQGMQQLDATIQQMHNIAKTLENGALIGQGGTAFTEGINSKLCPSIERLKDKFEELANDVQKAMEDMKHADTQAKQQFQS